ncbi:HNH endonuclease family protein [Acinetobacter baumannii 1295743]|uniref:HNH endonuclease family protein n=1 Tax=Acinetobacter baumannii (strain 1295743) TaxID=1310613 RepID=A0A009IFT1_ACIB9|nr:HNH endonuclease family protein [Acinetobacter baumannii 1295743]
MIASYEEGVIGVEQAKHLLDELEKLQYLWCLVEQNSFLTFDQFKNNLMNSTATNWVCARQEIEGLSCDLNALTMPYLKIGNELYLVWFRLNALPWSMYPSDTGHNFVLADSSCNSKKSNLLASDEFLHKWRERNEEQDLIIVDRISVLGFLTDKERSHKVADWAYAQGKENGYILFKK